MSATFYNRHDETARILSCLSQNISKNSILILVGNSGVGKSELIRVIFNEKLPDQRVIRVNVCRNSINTIENLHYINAIYRTMAELAGKNHFDKLITPRQHGITNLPNILRFVFKSLWSKFVGSEGSLYEPVDERGVLRKKSYIVSILKRQSYALCLDNIQNIDNQSFELLKEIMRQVSNTKLILEYTIDQEHDISCFYSFYNELRSFDADIFPFTIEKLRFEEAKRLAPGGVSEAQLKALYERSGGNLVEMLLAGEDLAHGCELIRQRIALFSKNDRFILDIIYLNGGMIEDIQLHKMLLDNLLAPPFSMKTIGESIHALNAGKMFAYADNGTYRLHGTVMDELKSQPVNSLLFVAYRVIKEYYMTKLAEYPDEEVVERLTQLFLAFSDEAISELLPYVQALIKSYKYKRPMLSRLSHFSNSISKQGNVSYGILCSLCTSMAAFCIEQGFPEEAQKHLNLIYSENNPYHRALQAAIYSLDCTNPESIEKARQLLQRAVTDKERLTIELCILSGTMASLPLEENLKTVQRLRLTPGYDKLFEYAYLLRDQAELTADYDDSIRLYQEALGYCRRAERQDVCDQIFVFMSMTFAYKGDLKTAKNLLSSISKRNFVPVHYLINNNAVLDILGNQQCAKTASMLNDALLIVSDPYEEIIIKCNLLVCYTLLGDESRAKDTYETIDVNACKAYHYEEFLHIVYQDLLFYHQSFNKTEDAEIDKRRIESFLKSALETSMSYRVAAQQMSETVSSDDFFAKFPFRVDFLGNWDLTISPDLERCQ